MENLIYRKILFHEERKLSYMYRMDPVWLSDKWDKYKSESKSMFSDKISGTIWFNKCYEKVFGRCYPCSFDKNAKGTEQFLKLFLEKEVELIGVFKDYDHLNRPRWCFYYL